MYLERILEVKPLQSEGIKGIDKQQYIEFKWNAWKSHRKAIVRYANAEDAQKALDAFKENPLLDNQAVKVAIKEPGVLSVDDLKPTTD